MLKRRQKKSPRRGLL